ncbi:MAG: hypothetical protein L6Q37_03870 [Bdellovibrionaceae bacterium]|nr:hypothetical protein [Pseudobdellovibrionaceae bacterium]NUM57981.1 hypothetical protein [Pseudobdellovibrionaceae bacterium]
MLIRVSARKLFFVISSMVLNFDSFAGESAVFNKNLYERINGRWEKPHVLCITSNSNQKYEVKEIKLFNEVTKDFYPEVVLNIYSEQKIAGAEPERYLEKAVIQRSCKLETKGIFFDQHPAGEKPYISSLNRIHIKPLQTKTGNSYGEMTAELVDSKIDFKLIEQCGASIMTTSSSANARPRVGILNYQPSGSATTFGNALVIGTLYKYPLYFKKEAMRTYNIYVSDIVTSETNPNSSTERLNLEFVDNEMCPSGTTKMIFSRKKTDKIYQ